MINDSNLVSTWCPKTRNWYGFQEIGLSCGCNSPKQNLLLSIITAVKDREIEFERALKSISYQLLEGMDNFNFENIEHVVQDGGGSRNRRLVIESYSKCHTILSNIPDVSLYNGFNVGLSLSGGTHIAFLNSDDYYEASFVKKTIQLLEISQADWVFGNILMLYPNGHSQLIPGKIDYFVSPWANFSRFHHTTVVCKREMFNEIGDFPIQIDSKDLNTCADYWWFLKAQKIGFHGVYHPSLLGYMSWGGASSGNLSEIFSEASFVASNLFPEKKFLIKFLWKLRFLTVISLRNCKLLLFKR